MTFQIDDAFIAKWHPKYDETENDESEYQKLVAQVSEEMRSSGTIGKQTFLDIWRWKGASRAIRHVRMEDSAERPAGPSWKASCKLLLGVGYRSSRRAA
jgi:hypothetical protein